ncbi:MAG: TnpV protein [Clostridia bacterium]
MQKVNKKLVRIVLAWLGQFDDEPEQEEIPLIKYAPARKAYLQQHHKAIYNHLLLTGKLQSHLRETQKQALHMLDELIPKLAKQQGVTNELKMQNQMQWVGMMNNIKAQVEEIIFSEIVYV